MSNIAIVIAAVILLGGLLYFERRESTRGKLLTLAQNNYGFEPTETIIHHVSSGFPGAMEGEYYLATPDECRAVFEYMDPRPAPAPYLVIKPLSMFEAGEEPETVVFFSRPESLGGLHQLVSFITARAALFIRVFSSPKPKPT